MNLKIKRLTDLAVLPTKKYVGDAGYDLYIYYNGWIRPHESLIIPLGIAIEIPEGYVGLIKEKSGLQFQIGAGIVDSNYRGELKVKLRNVTGYGVSINKNKAIAQLLILPCPNFELEEIENLSETERGKKGGINDI